MCDCIMSPARKPAFVQKELGLGYNQNLSSLILLVFNITSSRLINGFKFLIVLLVIK